MPTLDFYFDYVCPWAYLASTQVEALAARTGATLRWRPMLLGGVFAAQGVPQNLAGSMPRAKLNHLEVDRDRWAAQYGVPLRPPLEHPRRSVAALRATLARDCDPDVIHALFRAYWVEGRAIEDEAVVKAIAGEVDLDGQRDALRAATDDAVSHGVFGAPSYGVGDQLFWGQDRMHFVEEALTGRRPAQPEVAPVRRRQVDFWFDFSSPFAYLAATQLEALPADVRWRPMLLGAVFKSVGQVDVPLFAMCEAKRRYTLTDLDRWARWWRVPFRFPSTFPLRTVLPLRAVLAHPDPVPFARRVFHAAWAEDKDISSPAVLQACGASKEVLAAAEGQRQALFDSTSAALAAGVFGTPTFVVDGTELYWGQDRLAMLARSL